MSHHSEPPPADERRRFSRISFDAVVTLDHDSDRWQCKLIDISLKGVLLQRPNAFDAQTGDVCQVSIALDNGQLISMQTTLAHERNQSIGLACTTIDMDSFSTLKRLVELNLGDSELLNRELSALG
jgi:hypothetical protein